MADAQTLIGRVTLASSQTVISFNNLPQTYRDLVLVIQGNQASNTGCYITFNGDSASSYSWTRMWGDGSSAQSSSSFSSTFVYPGDIGPGNSSMITSVSEYSASDKHKAVLSRASDAAYVFFTSARWASLAPVTSLTITGSQAFESGFTFTLYGVSA